MPELPEVESLVCSLRPQLVSRRITAANFSWQNMLSGISLRQFKRKLAGSTFVSLGRRGKYLLFHLHSEGARSRHDTVTMTLVIHLKMSGHLGLFPITTKQAKHDRVIFRLNDGRELRFNDPRKFGRVYLVKDVEHITGKLGPEPLDPGFHLHDFRTRLLKRGGAIKPLLLNQAFLAGIGNIYADESLWRAGIHPNIKIGQLEVKQVDRLYQAIKRTLQLAIRYNGTDVGDGVVPNGDYRPKVYGREGLPCQRCRSGIKRIVVGQRGTHFCPLCQRQPTRYDS